MRKNINLLLSFLAKLKRRCSGLLSGVSCNAQMH